MEEVIRQKAPNWKVKVYLLNEGGNWDDCGTGSLELHYDPDNEKLCDYIQVVKVEDRGQPHAQMVSHERLEKLKKGNQNPTVILYSTVEKEYDFEKQGGKFILNNLSP
jgi:hypothetical protein